ncbi:regulator of sirC expression with transglutaminase-like and TPR domain [Parvibaculum sp. MBR-TMA-1.3b-4.2]|jgi:regulator of sirC expression with transglutaminase-like and TPR domain
MIPGMGRPLQQTDDEIERRLRAAGTAGEGDIDIAETALLLAACDRPDLSLGNYRDHLALLCGAVREAMDRASQCDAHELAELLGGVISGLHGYRGDAETYDDPRNANLMEVIDRRKGLPVALGIVWLHVAARLGLDLAGLNFPGHFVLRLRTEGSGPRDAAIVDPFNGGQLLTSADLLSMIRQVEGPDAALSPDAYAEVSPRDILLRLQNNILMRAVRSNDFARARDVVTRMIWIAPERAGLLFELGRLEVHDGRMGAAIDAFASCYEKAVDLGEDRIAEMAEQALRELKPRLN